MDGKLSGRVRNETWIDERGKDRRCPSENKKEKIKFVFFFKVGRNFFSFPYVKVRYICLHYILKVEIWLQGYGMKDYCPPILLKDVSGGKKTKTHPPQTLS